MTTPIIELRNVSKQYRETESSWVDALRPADLAIYAGEFFTLLGPSGCGKSTALRIIAGFETPDSGDVVIQNQAMNSVPPHRRPVNMVFQDYALFPHLSVAQNIEYGLKMKKIRRDERRARVQEMLELVRLSGLGGRRPHQLSGGQRQRVALARALVNRPSVLLLDEPLGALDLKLRRTMQAELKQLQQHLGITFVHVTHDQEEALAISDRIAVMNDGRFLQVGTPQAIYEEPQTRFIADFVGETNFMAGLLRHHRQDIATVLVGGQELEIAYTANSIHPGDALTVAVRPEKMQLLSEDAPHSLAGVIEDSAYLGIDVRYMVRTDEGDPLIVRSLNGEFDVGDRVGVRFSANDARILVE